MRTSCSSSMRRCRMVAERPNWKIPLRSTRAGSTGCFEAVRSGPQIALSRRYCQFAAGRSGRSDAAETAASRGLTGHEAGAAIGGADPRKTASGQSCRSSAAHERLHSVFNDPSYRKDDLRANPSNAPDPQTLNSRAERQCDVNTNDRRVAPFTSSDAENLARHGVTTVSPPTRAVPRFTQSIPPGSAPVRSRCARPATPCRSRSRPSDRNSGCADRSAARRPERPGLAHRNQWL